MVVGGVAVPAGHRVYVLDQVVRKGRTDLDGLIGMDVLGRCGGLVLEVEAGGSVRVCAVRVAAGETQDSPATERGKHTGMTPGCVQFMLRGVSRRRAAWWGSRAARQSWERVFRARVHALQVPEWEVEMADSDSITDDMSDEERAYVTAAHHRRHVVGSEDFEAAGDLRHEFEALISEFEGALFHDHVGPEPLKHLPPMRIEMPEGTKPVACKPRRFSPVVTELIQMKVEEMLRAGIIRPSSSEWSANVVPVLKSSGEGVNRLRVTVDLSRMNRLTKNPKIPLPSMTELMGMCAGATCFTTFDASDFYFQSALEEGSKAYTAFYAAGELYEFNRVPQGCSGSPGYCQRVIKQVVGTMYRKNAVALLDDVLVWAKDPQEMLGLLRTLFERMAEYGVRLKRRKCCFVRRRVAWMGMQIGVDGITPLPERAEAIARYPRPTTKQEVTSFTSLMQFYSSSLPGLAHTLAPLRKLQRKHVPFEWDADCEQSFQVARQALLSSSALAHMQFDRTFYILTDASKDGLGVVVAQRQGPTASGPLKAVRYLSRQTRGKERDMPAWGLEMLALTFAVEKLRDLLLGMRCVMLCDHRSLLFLFGDSADARMHEKRILTMRCKLSKYPFTLLYVKGEDNPADALSRVKVADSCALMDRRELPDEIRWALAVCRGEVPLAEVAVTGGDDATVGDGVPAGDASAPRNDDLVAFSARQALAGVQGQRVAGDQVHQHDLGAVGGGAGARGSERVDAASVAAVRRTTRKGERVVGLTMPRATCERHPVHGGAVGGASGATLTLPTRVEMVLAQQQDAVVGLLDLPEAAGVVPWGRHHIRREQDGLVVVKMCKAEVWVPLVPACYRRLWLITSHGEHVGVRRTREALRRTGYWWGVDEDVRDFVGRCLTCAKNKRGKPMRHGRVRSYPAQRTFQQVQIDLVGPLPRSRSGNRVVLSMYDRLSHWVELVPLPDGTARRVAYAIWSEIVCRYGLPEEFQSDRGRAFVSQTLKELADYMRVKWLHASAYSPQEQGGCERMHRVLGAQLRMLCQGLDDVWDEYLPTTAFVMRTSFSEALGTTPFHVMFGRHPRLPTDMFTVKDTDQELEEGVTGVRFADRLAERMRQIHKRTQEHTRMYQQQRYARINEKQGRVEVEFGLGTQVLMYRNRVRRDKSKKLEIPFVGPLRVVRRTGRRYVLRHVESGELFDNVKVDRIIPFTFGDEMFCDQVGCGIDGQGEGKCGDGDVLGNSERAGGGDVRAKANKDEGANDGGADDEGDSSDEDVGVAVALEGEEEYKGELGPDVEARACFKCLKPAPTGVVCVKCGVWAHVTCAKVRVDDLERLWVCSTCLATVEVKLEPGGFRGTRQLELSWPGPGEDRSAKIVLEWNDVPKSVQRLADSSARGLRSRRRRHGSGR